MGHHSRDSAMMQDASRLAAAGSELGNADAIRLLQVRHSTEDVQDLLRVFAGHLSPGARSKLTLDALAPSPPDVVNQRSDPIFDKHPISGETYITGSGAVVPNELQYYNGETAQLYGECTDVAAVNAALAGSGYQAVTLKYTDGRQTAVAQLWANRFTDTTLGPYSAMFMVIAAVRDDLPADQASIRADLNGTSSVLVMLDGSYDSTTAIYENRARLFMVRLLDTTQVAIDVGRERMGTDKRPGTIEVVRTGRRLRVRISAAGGRGVMKADLELADDPAAYVPAVAKAAATAGIPFRTFPRNTEFVYPAVARIGRGPVVSWHWRTDLLPQVQPVPPGAVILESTSEEGRLLLAWGFMPKALGYIPNVRGVITGLENQRQQSRNNFTSIADEPLAATSSIAAPLAARHGQVDVASIALRRAAHAGELARATGQLPVFRFAAQKLAPFLEASVTPPTRGQDPGMVAVSRQPRWDWGTAFLGSFSGMLRKEVIGDTPDGLRIDWHLMNGTFTGPDIDLVALPGAIDWARIRKDGVGIVNVQACFETPTGERVYVSYGGLFDLGPDGYRRALRDEFDPLPPVVVTPTFATAHPGFAWLNRAQCIGVGRVDMTALRIEFDVYAVRVGDSTQPSSADGSTVSTPTSPTPESLTRG
jgi:hypothetical protein